MDLATISQELNKRFLAPLPEFYKRRNIVWYDEEKEFLNQIEEFRLQDAEVICVTGNNYFEIKKTLAVDEPNQNFLLYNPMTYETADIISTFVFRMGLGSGNYSYATAVGLFEALLNLILLTVANKVSKKVSGSGLW